jgi:hypothetical protein
MAEVDSDAMIAAASAIVWAFADMVDGAAVTQGQLDCIKALDSALQWDQDQAVNIRLRQRAAR